MWQCDATSARHRCSLSRHPYATATYAEALAGTGPQRPIDVPEWGTFVIARPTPSDHEDAIGPYPRTPLAAGADIQSGLEGLKREGLVSVVLVTDPIASAGPERLARDFPICLPFKTHLVIDRSKGGFEPTPHHLSRIRRGHRRCEIHIVQLAEALTSWIDLYAGLKARHQITGTADFAPTYFAALADMPEFVAIAASVSGEIVAMTIWLEHEGGAYSHLTAANAVGYANGAIYALNDAAISHFSHARLIDLGGGAGAEGDPSDGLFQFKSGFANDRRTAMLCGAILDRGRYEQLSAGHATTFFPAYRG